MSEIIYDLHELRSQNIPPESLTDWMAFVTATNTRSAYWLMRSFIDTYGIETFWAYKDQQMKQKYGVVLSSSQKIEYINNMMNSEDSFVDE